MRILALADFHSQKHILEDLKTFLQEENFDLAVIAGDLTIPGPAAYPYILSLDDILEKHQLPWLAVHGNNDPPEVIQFLHATSRNLHFEPKQFSGYHFIGIGGWGDELPPYDIKTEGAILITHIPPTLRRSPQPPTLSRSFHSPLHPHPSTLRDSPLLHLAGHIHHHAKITDIGPTRVVNIPAALLGRAAIIELPNRKVEFISL